MAEHRGIHTVAIPRVATGLCAGIAHTNSTCGAALGGVMALGLILGRDGGDGSPEPCFVAVRRFLCEFESRFGSTNCLALTGCDAATPEGRLRYRDQNIGERCRGFVAAATRLALQIAEGAGPP